MILGTHNSGTGGQLQWWLRPFAWLINPTSKCQSRSIAQQLDDGVRVFNLQVTKYNGKWVFSHGLAIYKKKLIPALESMEAYASADDPIYFQLVLDDNYITGQPADEFRRLVDALLPIYKEGNVKMLYAWVENSQEYPYRSGIKLDMEEHYWTLGWAKANAKSLLDWLPLPKRHASKHNAEYKENRTKEYLMLDYYEL